MIHDRPYSGRPRSTRPNQDREFRSTHIENRFGSVVQTAGTIHGRQNLMISANAGLRRLHKIRFGNEEPSLVPYVITVDNAYSFNLPETTQEHPGLIQTQTMSCKRRLALSIVPKLRKTVRLPKTGRAVSLPLRPAD